MKKVLLLNFLFLFALLGQVMAQSRTVTGKVTAAGDGVPLPGVSVVVKGTTTGTATNADGSFSVNVPADAGTLVFRYIGYVTKEVAVGSNSTVNVALELDNQQLSEVVISVPYGTVAKTAFTGAESTITARAIEKQQVTSVSRAIEGLVPGVQVTNGGGQPGSSATIRVRGIGSVNASSDPLYIVDGIAFDGTLSSISNDDIASIQVLKDAAASALYGARAANGVIMITTKKGKKGKPTVAVNVRSGLSERLVPEYDRVNSQEYYELMWEAMRNNRLAAVNPATKVPYTPDEAVAYATENIGGKNGLVYNPFNVPANQVINPATGKLNPGVNLLYEDSWEDALFRTASRQDINMNVSGGADKSDYFLSLGYVNEKGIVKFSDYDRFNGRLKVNSDVTDWLKAGMNLSSTLSSTDGLFADGTATSNPFYYTRNMGPIYPVWQRDASGNFVKDPVTGANALDWGKATQMGARPYAGNSNLLGSLDLDDRSLRRVEATANAFVETKFLKDFTFRTTLGGNIYDALTVTFQNSLFGDADNVKGRGTKANTRQISYTFNQVLTYNKQIGSHNFTVLGGHENYFLDSDFVTATRSGYPFPGISELAPAATAEGSNSYVNKHRLEGYFTSLNYDYNQKYLLSASFRRDGSSRFYEDVRWGNFWSVGGGYRISEESFMTADWIDDMKLRASYGEQGNEALPSYYAWQGLYSLGWNNVGRPGVIISSLPNQELQWEKNSNFNVGVDFSLFNKVEGTVEYFNKVSDNLLFAVPLPYSTGITTRDENAGSMKNYGFEVQLGYNAIRTADFDWRIDVNMSRYKNEITKLPQEEIISGTKKLMVGRSIYDFFIREYAGVDPNNGDALYYKDVLGEDGKPTGERITTNNINQGSQYYQGTAIPDLVGGVTNSLRFKNFDFSVLVTYSLGGKFYDGNYATLMHPGSYGSAWHKDILNRWTPENRNTDVPRVQNALATQNGISSRYLFDATWANVKNINLGYTLPTNLAGKVGLNSVRAFLAVDNAYLYTTEKGMDPQRSFTGTSDFTYPPFRTYTFGLNVNI
ncbi:SusC/RagA family TonB-linked outer membrane protein [Pontibacter roseus]|uniref:SusC/RagA family TonB-linked outer membrane protein n=1 Tax=Pontibacter roseus TaxID=336989 RepID=UPI0003A5AAD0|nr:TonB-dependent receptor [Pontibacter roseus]